MAGQSATNLEALETRHRATDSLFAKSAPWRCGYDIAGRQPASRTFSPAPCSGGAPSDRFCLNAAALHSPLTGEPVMEESWTPEGDTGDRQAATQELIFTPSCVDEEAREMPSTRPMPR
eukprot:CAMPEP_0113697138 /NCGR_PEP_ID=MMETSP0038_2-20120614/21956_1 /TAXON_ID=2898 /ORGANISM="Cryptomonas paramecium" /LENGTH=118 /DNA_ID=CAMNT_0000620093 /DNA_START=91 /DNA_END=447 /DNA_ORIENTATION=+ /assembly_acc=CAM_ASM_000170